MWANFFIGKTLFSVLNEWGILTFLHNMFQNATFRQIKKIGMGPPRIFLVYHTLDLLSTFHANFEVLKFLGGPQRPLEKGIFWLKIDQFFTFGSKKHNI